MVDIAGLVSSAMFVANVMRVLRLKASTNNVSAMKDPVSHIYLIVEMYLLSYLR